MRVTKYLAAAAAVAVAGSLAWGAGIFQTYPIIGGSSYCASTVLQGSVQGSITGQGGGPASAGTVTGTTICAQTVPAGPPALTGNEVFPVDLYTPGTQQYAGVATADLPVTALGAGYGTTQVITTNAALAVANGVSLLISNQAAATLGTLTLPPAPMQGQRFCISNAGSGALTLGTIQVGTSGQSIVQGAAPTNLAVETANTVAAASPMVCWSYNVSNTSWYRVL